MNKHKPFALFIPILYIKQMEMDTEKFVGSNFLAEAQK